MRTSIDVALDPPAAFEAFVEELRLGLGRAGFDLEPEAGGRVMRGNELVGRIEGCVPGERMVLRWRPAAWQPEAATQLELRVEARANGARLTLEHRGLAPLLDGGMMPLEGVARETVGWFAAEVATPFLRSLSSAALGDWLTDRRARRPSGPQSREIYRDPLFHYPGFRALLGELAPTADDYLLEVACGGGALLRDILATGCRAAAVDHSPDMVRVAREANADAVRDGRLHVARADAAALPFVDDAFTCAAMAGVLGFLADPVRALAEIRRVLRDGGRVVVQGSDPELRGTPGAPEPMASRLRFYESDELAALARAAGYDDVDVVQRPLQDFARAVGIPEEYVSLFEGPGGRMLVARK